MSSRGVHFSLSSEEVERLRAINDERARVEHLQEVIEEEYFSNQPERKAESDKAWDAIHRSLGDGELGWEGGSYPLSHVVLGGERLYTGDDYIMVLKGPAVVHDAAPALRAVTEEDFRARYFAIDPDSYDGTLDETDFEYTWSGFQEIRDLWLRADAEGRSILFTADQ